MPSANAMSVAAGTAQPCIATASPRLIQAKIAAGTATPASAHATGSATLRQRGQLPGQRLALELQRDQQEEDRHQAVVDPQQQRLGDLQPAHLHRHRQFAEAVVGSSSGEL